MKSPVQLKTAIPLILITIAFAGVGFLSPNAFGVVPAPDGGYPGGNTAEGQAALLSLTTGGFNTAVGFFSLRSDTTGGFNTAIGAGALLANTADNNTATGAGALLSNTGNQNTATGAFALFSNTIGIQNAANGYLALFHNTTGSDNTASGLNALGSNTTGEGNTALGDAALVSNTTGDFNTAVGLLAGSNVATASNVICIGTAGFDVSDSCFIGHIRGAVVSPDAVPVLVDSSHKLGTMNSSRRFKKEIKPMNNTSEAILGLKPVTFHYKSDSTNTPQFGLIAEEVAQVNPDLVVRDENGEIYTVRYDAMNAMLLNEFLKEHKAFLEEQSKVQNLEAALRAVNQRLKEQEAKIERVSAQIETGTATRQMVSNQ